MKALCYHAPRTITCDSVPDAKLESDTDILVRMTACGICGSDLHIYHGHGFSPDLGYCVGHEAVGEVVEVGRSVQRVRSGDRVMISAAVGCGGCAPCLAGNVLKCETGGSGCYGLSHALEGCQSEAIRVPKGDFNVALIPDGVSEEQALMLTDNLPTAWFGCVGAEIGPGKTVVVVGLGPIGLMAVESAFVMGASRVFAVDLVAERRAIARSLGAEAFDASDAVEAVREATSGRMADCAVEAVGADATINLAMKLVGRQGIVSAIGVNQTKKFDFPMALAFVKTLTFRIGTCSVPRYWPDIVPLVQSGRLKPERYITHRLSLDQGAEAYRLFDAREDGVLKTVMTP